MARVYWLGPIRIANFGFQFANWLTWNNWRAFRLGKSYSWSVTVH